MMMGWESVIWILYTSIQEFSGLCWDFSERGASRDPQIVKLLAIQAICTYIYTYNYIYIYICVYVCIYKDSSERYVYLDCGVVGFGFGVQALGFGFMAWSWWFRIEPLKPGRSLGP